MMSFFSHIKELTIFYILIVLFTIFSIFVPNFFSFDNIVSILRQVSAFTVIAFGEFFVIVSGGFDLSIGSTIGFVGIVVASLIKIVGLNFWFAMFMALMVCLLIGLFNGTLVVWGTIPPFIATLATMVIVRGINFLISNGIPISGFPESFGYLGRGYIGLIPVPVVMMAITSFVCYLFMEHTETGRCIYAVGGNEEATRLSGVNVAKIKVLVYVLSSFFAGVGAIMIASRIMAGQPTVGDNMLFDVVTAVVLGGTALSGGKGNILGVISGAIILGMVANAMVLLRIGTYWQWIIKGIILAIVVLIDSKTKERG